MAARTVLTSNTLEEFRTTFNSLSSTDIGDLASLTTSAGSIVGAINEVDAAIGTGNFTVADDSSTTTEIALGVDTLTVLGGTGLETSLSGDILTISDSTSGVSAATYGSTTAIPVLTINDKGRITSATTAGITTSLTIADSSSTNGTIALATDTLTFEGGAGLSAAISGDVVTYNFDGVTFTNYEYTATTGQATFGGSDNNGNTLAYTAGKIDVFLNGVRLASSDYTATNGSTISLSTGAIGGDILVAKAFVTINTSLIEIVNDTTPQLGGNLDVNGNSIVSVSNGDISITPDGTGDVILDGLKYPQADGTTGQFLKTDGSGQLAFATVDTNLVNDTTPQLGGNLDLNSSDITGTGNINITGTIQSSGDITGTLATAAQPNITSLGTLSSLTISGDLTVNGTTTTINSTTLTVDDKNIELGSVDSPSDTTADGGGITLKGATDHTFNWVNSTDAWTSSEHINLASGKEYKINGTSLKDVTETLTNKTLTSPTITSGTVATSLDMNGTELVLDADADTSITADTDDQVDIKIGGTDRFSIASTGKVTVTSTGAASNFDVVGTDAGTLGPDLTLHHNSASPADSDTVGFISFAGNDDGANKTTYVQLRGVATDVTDATEDGRFSLFTMKAGTLTEQLRVEEDGDLHADGNVIAYSTTISDVALKSDINVIPNALDKLDEIRGVTFTRHNGKQSAGIIAQELEKVLPQAINETELPLQMNDGKKYKTVEYDAIHGLLIQAIKELKQELNDLKNKS